ncbi:MAG: hypothetical protein EXR69_00250 [Myxococcales bacterium]|nr:hypothetical protein [Myxococcales bacterium]
MSSRLSLCPLLAVLGCSGQPADDSAAPADTDADTDADSDTDTDSDTDADTDTGDIELPASPFPIILALSGDANESVRFDTVVCSHPPNNQLQLTYSDSTSASSWNLRVFVRETFSGAGTYSTTVEAQLLENVSGGRYFSASTSTGAAVALTVEGFGTNGAFGSLTTDPLTMDASEVAVSPQPIPFWCDVIAD